MIEFHAACRTIAGQTLPERSRKTPATSAMPMTVNMNRAAERSGDGPDA